MAIIKCTECGGNVSDKAESCPHCGAPVKPMLEELEKQRIEAEAKIEDEKQKNNNEETKSPSKKTALIIVAVIIALAAAGFAYYQATKDVDPPVFSGIENGQTIDITCGTDFNLKDYITENLKITDNKDGELADYTISVDEKIYDSETGKIDTREKGEFDVKIEAQDKAENAASLNFALNLDPIHITKDNPTPVIYDGELGKIEVTSFRHGYFWGENQYEMKVKYTNNTEKWMSVWMISAMTYVDNEQMNVYHPSGSGVMPGKSREDELSIYDEDLKKHEKAKKIETAMGILEKDETSPYFWIPMTIDLDAAK